MKSSALVVYMLTRAQLSEMDHGAFVDQFNPALTPSAELRHQMGSVIVMVEGFESDPLAACDDPDVRQFFQLLHKQWPHCGFYFSTSGDYFRAYMLCIVSYVTIQRKLGQKTVVSEHGRNELFKLLGGGIEHLEKTCALAAVGPSDFRQRARLLLRYFDFLAR